ncbi:hypothetical protein [Myroides odoratus]|uniref:Uncharacterized protein n=1 Tax=Myroides odoratus TaxID=256 RepID=A0A378RMD6_MYROD|nr:hypothetical protein [Myroides odoratus]MCS4239050.1 hypothetical protein [Myroides odoratus]QQU04438.1 hypothetical protein I6I89_03900 [Myroides odoratus]STZ28134.1 Uncharacterised protein [Myroides odoratus]
MKKLLVGLALALSFGSLANTKENNKNEQVVEVQNCYQIEIYSVEFFQGIKLGSMKIGTHRNLCTSSEAWAWYNEIIASYDGVGGYNPLTKTEVRIQIPLMPELLAKNQCHDLGFSVVTKPLPSEIM